LNFLALGEDEDMTLPTLLATALLPLTSVPLLNGVYQPIEGNEPSICPQKIRVRTIPGRPTQLAVTYAGDCGDQGPFSYDCFLGGPEGGPMKQVCLQGDIEFEILDARHYRWSNRAYGFHALFEFNSTSGMQPETK